MYVWQTNFMCSFSLYFRDFVWLETVEMSRTICYCRHLLGQRRAAFIFVFAFVFAFLLCYAVKAVYFLCVDSSGENHNLNIISTLCSHTLYSRYIQIFIYTYSTYIHIKYMLRSLSKLADNL